MKNKIILVLGFYCYSVFSYTQSSICSKNENGHIMSIFRDSRTYFNFNLKDFVQDTIYLIDTSNFFKRPCVFLQEIDKSFITYVLEQNYFLQKSEKKYIYIVKYAKEGKKRKVHLFYPFGGKYIEIISRKNFIGRYRVLKFNSFDV